MADGSWYHFDGNQIATILGYLLMLDPRGPKRQGLVIETLVTTKALARIVDANSDAAERIAFVQVFGEVDVPAAINPLLNVLNSTTDELLQTALLGSLARYNEARIAEAVVARFNQVRRT